MAVNTAIIEKLAFGGSGVCRIDGKVCFVPYSSPGDEVSLRITSQKKSYCTAEIIEIINPSPSRIIPICSIFAECGGCNWQHIDYSAQLEHKRKIMADALWRGARVPGDLVADVVAAESQYAYRSRLQFKVSVRHGKLSIGFYRHGSHRVVDAADGCPVAVPLINQALAHFRELLESYPDIGTLSQLAIDAGDSGVIAVLHHDGKVTSTGRDYIARHSGSNSPCTGIFLKIDKQARSKKIWGSSVISYRMRDASKDHEPLIITYPPGGFAQVHQKQNISMLSVIKRLGDFAPTEQLLDLYCGNGNFSLPLADVVAFVTGIEENADSIRHAMHNGESNKVANVRFICDDAAAGARRLFEQGRKFDTVLLDPPRSGAGEAISVIVDLQPAKIIYVSCDPSTLARDCGLLSGCGYSVVKSVPIDMFPQTYHLESITLLQRA